MKTQAMILRAMLQPALIAFLLAAPGLALPANAADAPAPAAQPSCAVPPALEFSDAALPMVAAKLKANETVRIVVIGSGSSAGMGASTVVNAYPQHLAADLAQLIPGAKVEVENLSRRGLLASEMVKMFPQQVIAKHPDLVIWQTGTVDAVQGVDVGSFGQTLANGLQELQDRGIDVILMNMQYSPLTATALNVGRYIDYMRWLAQNHSALLFDRYSIMRYWEENDAIDVSAASKAEQTRDDDFVHGCIAKLLSEVIQNAIAGEGAGAPKP